MRGRVLLIMIVIMVAGVLIMVHRKPPTPQQTSQTLPQAQAPSPNATATETRTPAPVPSGTSSSASRRPLSGAALARAWLTGYLTRPSGRDDLRWVSAVEDFTSPALLDLLQTRGPGYVGLRNLTAWRVAKIVPYECYAAVGVSTPSREVLAYTVTVTDGTTSHDKPFILTAYLDTDRRWLVSLVEQPYESEG